MSDKTDLSLLPPSSESLPPDPSLERLLSAIARGLDGLVQSSQLSAKNQAQQLQLLLEIQKSYSDLAKSIRSQGKRTEQALAEQRLALDHFIKAVHGFIASQQVIAGTNVEARKALDDSRTSLDEAASAFKEVTGKHKIPPEFLQHNDTEEISTKWIKLRWTTIFSAIKIGWPVAAKILAIGIAIAAAIYEAVKNIAPYIKGWH